MTTLLTRRPRARAVCEGYAYGRLLAVEVLPGAAVGRPNAGAHVRCRCACGVRVTYLARHVAAGLVVSCGCKRRKQPISSVTY